MISVQLGDNESLSFAWCPPGSYKQVTRGTSLSYKTKEYIVDVNFDKGFWLSEVPVTNGQWKAIMGKLFFEIGNFSKTVPVYGLDLRLIESFLDKINSIGLSNEKLKGKLVFSLPNYLQARYASMSRISESEILFWEAENMSFEDFTWYQKNSGNMIHEVAQKRCSPWGLYDMFGNIYEVSSDVKAQLSQKIIINPLSTMEGSGLSIVGGGYDRSYDDCISSMVRNASEENEYIEPYGFRLICSASVD